MKKIAISSLLLITQITFSQGFLKADDQKIINEKGDDLSQVQPSLELWNELTRRLYSVDDFISLHKKVYSMSRHQEKKVADLFLKLVSRIVDLLHRISPEVEQGTPEEYDLYRVAALTTDVYGKIKDTAADLSKENYLKLMYLTNRIYSN